MTTFTAVHATPPVRRPWRARAAGIGRWAVRILLATQFVAGGVLKLAGDPSMVAMFEDIGAGQGLRLLIGACEVAGGIGVLLPRASRLAAAGLLALMVGAVVTNAVVLEVSPVLPLVLGALALLVAVTRTQTKAGR